MTAVTLCTMCLVGVGLLLLISGAVVTGIVYTEVRPPTADENYDRYRGADLRRVLGPADALPGRFSAYRRLRVHGLRLLLQLPRRRIWLFTGPRARLRQQPESQRCQIV
uniref:Putative secreted protein n=1 Tax=Ixodes scapularis TaxID=6945 RepID=A0A4D5S010_IXOSC